MFFLLKLTLFVVFFPTFDVFLVIPFHVIFISFLLLFTQVLFLRLGFWLRPLLRLRACFDYQGFFIIFFKKGLESVHLCSFCFNRSLLRGRLLLKCVNCFFLFALL